ncbi:hypothetical protein ZWY2020_007464 [Hordeum vulgare]|nr:hypothetical protein ZWY2020_007464 [Hordeum vulgare]
MHAHRILPTRLLPQAPGVARLASTHHVPRLLLRVTSFFLPISLPWPRSLSTSTHFTSVHGLDRSWSTSPAAGAAEARRKEQWRSAGSYVHRCSTRPRRYGAGALSSTSAQADGRADEGHAAGEGPVGVAGADGGDAVPAGRAAAGAVAGLALAGTVVGLAVATPVFLLFSPVLVPAALTIGMASPGFLASRRALQLGGLSSLTVLANTARQAFSARGGLRGREARQRGRRRRGRWAQDAAGRPRHQRPRRGDARRPHRRRRRQPAYQERRRKLEVADRWMSVGRPRATMCQCLP